MQLAAASRDHTVESRARASPVTRPARSTPASEHSSAAITVDWLVRLRWGAVLGQTVIILVAALGFGLELPRLPLALLVGVTVVSNGALAVRLRRSDDVGTRTVGLVLAADILVLAGLLYFSGGPSNPFSVMYLVQVTLAALVLGMRWAVGMTALSAISYAALFFWHVPVAGTAHHHHQNGSAFSAHLQGMWIAFTIAAFLIAYFVARVAGSLRAREAELTEARAKAARTEKLASLTSLAAGAAHELGTPLATIAVASKELERTVRSNVEGAIDDARLIRTEVERCRAIVHRMSAQAGETIGELPRSTTATEIYRDCLARLGDAASSNLVVEHLQEGNDATFTCPPEGLVQVVLSLVQNGRWAVRTSGGTVRLSSSSSPEAVRLVVKDDGVGIAPDVLVRLGEPFFTTKPPGEGMGLGLFLARTFAERWGGTLAIESREGRGTIVAIELPRSGS